MHLLRPNTLSIGFDPIVSESAESDLPLLLENEFCGVDIDSGILGALFIVGCTLEISLVTRAF